MGSSNNDFLALDVALGLGLGSTWQYSRVTRHNKCSSIVSGTTQNMIFSV